VIRGAIVLLRKAYQYRIYPNKEQRELLAQHFGCARWVYNWGLAKKKQYYEEHQKSISKRHLQDELVALKKTEDKKWLNEVNSQTLLAALVNLDKAFKNFFSKKHKFPKFKKKYSGHQSYQCPQHVTVDFTNSVIDLPKIKQIKAKFHREFVGKIKTCTIKKTATDKYYISILVETENCIPISTTVEPEYTVGIDFGIKELLITSNGATEKNNKYLSKSIKKIKKLQKQLAKKQAKSANRAKVRKKLARAYEKTANQRLDNAHQASAKLVYKSQDTSFAVEDLHIKGMMKNHKLAKAIGDCGWGIFLKTLEYKSSWSGKNVIKIDRWLPSSKTCSGCGNVKSELSLSERSYSCEKCGLEIDRDHNAAINIKNFALAKLGLGQPEDKLVDHALAGSVSDRLAIHGMKQEAPTRIALAI